MARVLGPGGRTCGSAPQIIAHLRREISVGGGSAVSWRTDLQDEVQDAELAGSAKRLASRLYVPAKDRALTRQAVPPLNEESPHRPNAGGVDVRRKHGIISRSAPSGSASRRFCG